jgi:hypothetical protein
MMHKILLLVSLSLACAYSANYSAWSKSASVYVKTTPDWANITATTVNFPLLVRLDSATFNFNETKAGGADVRFAKADGTTPIPFEIESWDATAGRAALWLLMDTIKGNAQQEIKMYWGNDTAHSISKSSVVFDTGNGFMGVWHLSDSVSSAVNKDATAAARDGNKMPAAGAIPVVETPLGTGQHYNMTTNYNYTQISKGSLPLANKSMTISAWIKRDTLSSSSYDYFIAQGTQDPQIGLRFGFASNNKFTLNFINIDENLFTKPMPYLDWHLWTGVYDAVNTTMSLYHDGQLDTSSTGVSAFSGSDATTFCWAYGLSAEYHHPRGTMDEARISSVARSADWIALEYANQRPDQKLVSNPVPLTCTTDFGVDQTTVSITEGQTLKLTGKAKCSLRTAWVRLDGTTETPLVSQGLVLTQATRVRGNTTLTYRFKALYSTGWQSQDVSVSIAEAIPEPEFTLTLPATFDISDASAVLVAKPVISNSAVIAASAFPKINFAWTVTGPTNYHVADGDSMSFYIADTGALTVQLCLDNGGDPLCKQATTLVTNGSGVIKFPEVSSKQFFQCNLSGQKILMHIKCKSASMVDIFSVAGSKLYSRTIAAGDFHRAVPVNSKGIYFVQIRSKTMNRVQRIIVW